MQRQKEGGQKTKMKIKAEIYWKNGDYTSLCIVEFHKQENSLILFTELTKARATQTIINLDYVEQFYISYGEEEAKA